MKLLFFVLLTIGSASLPLQSVQAASTAMPSRKLVADVTLPIVAEGHTIGSFSLKAGSSLDVVSDNGTNAVILRGGGKYTIASSSLTPTPSPAAYITTSVAESKSSSESNSFVPKTEESNSPTTNVVAESKSSSTSLETEAPKASKPDGRVLSEIDLLADSFWNNPKSVKEDPDFKIQGNRRAVVLRDDGEGHHTYYLGKGKASLFGIEPYDLRISIDEAGNVKNIRSCILDSQFFIMEKTGKTPMRWIRTEIEDVRTYHWAEEFNKTKGQLNAELQKRFGTPKNITLFTGTPLAQPAKLYNAGSFFIQLLENDRQIILNIFKTEDEAKGVNTEIKKNKTDRLDAFRSRVKSAEDGTKYIIVPMENMGHRGYCGIAEQAELMRYLGFNISLDNLMMLRGITTLENSPHIPPFIPTLCSVNISHQKKFTWEKVKEYIDKGLPIQIFMKLKNSVDSQHYALITAYNEKEQFVLTTNQGSESTGRHGRWEKHPRSDFESLYETAELTFYDPK